MIEEVTSQCHQCSTLRQLPKILLEDTTETPKGIGTDLAADVIERNTQKILIVKDKLSQYTKGILIPDQTADTLKKFLLSLVLEILPDAGTTIRVDGATAFQTLENESKNPGSLLSQLLHMAQKFRYPSNSEDFGALALLDFSPFVITKP